MNSIEFDLDRAIMRVSVAEMGLRYDYTAADIEQFAVVLRKVALEVDKIAERAKHEAQKVAA